MDDSILRALIRESIIAEDDTVVTAPTQPPSPQGLRMRDSMLAQSYKKEPWTKLIVYRPPGKLWEVTPRIASGKLVGFSFYRLRMARQPDPIVPSSDEELSGIENEFDLDRGIMAPHVTVIR